MRMRVWRKGNSPTLLLLFSRQVVNWESHYGEQYGGSLKTKNSTTKWPISPTTGHTSWENCNSKWHIHSNVHCSTLYNQVFFKVEALVWWVGKASTLSPLVPSMPPQGPQGPQMGGVSIEGGVGWGGKQRVRSHLAQRGQRSWWYQCLHWIHKTGCKFAERKEDTISSRYLATR